MTSKERILRQLRGGAVDRIPMFGGWNLGVMNLAELAGMSVSDYLADPWFGVLQANRNLGVDGLVPPIVPTDVESIRAGSLQEESFAEVQPEALVTYAEQIPAGEAQVLSERFDPAQTEADYRRVFRDNMSRMGEFVYIPTLWEAPANFSLYFAYGYEAFLAATALYPDALERIWWESGVIGNARNTIIAKLMEELDIVPMLFCGHDICLNDGPMCSPAMLRERYWPHAKHALKPFVDAGIRLIHHCDGNVMPIVDDMIQAGFSGFQGFQYECGVDPRELRKRRSLRGEQMLFMAGLSVTRTLPFGAPDDVRLEVDYCLDFTDGGQGLFLFTSNVTGVEVPPENIRSAYAHLRGYDPGKPWESRGVVEPPALDIEPTQSVVSHTIR